MIKPPIQKSELPPSTIIVGHYARAREAAAGPAVVLFCGILFAAGAGGVAAQQWGRVGASGLASARIGLTGVCSL